MDALSINKHNNSNSDSFSAPMDPDKSDLDILGLEACESLFRQTGNDDLCEYLQPFNDISSALNISHSNLAIEVGDRLPSASTQLFSPNLISADHGNSPCLSSNSLAIYAPSPSPSRNTVAKYLNPCRSPEGSNYSSPVLRQTATDTHLFEGASSADGHIYQVRFKRASRYFLLHATAPHDIIVGDVVRVEADRGEDVGIVQSRTHASDFREHIPTAGYRGRGFNYGQGERKWLYRKATTMELLQLHDKAEDEAQALEVVRSKVECRGFPMSIVECELQADRHKMTFYFEAERRIDFRELVTELFSLYKTRIWMHQVDTAFLEEDEQGVALAKCAGLLLDAESLLPLPDVGAQIDCHFHSLAAETPLLQSMDKVRARASAPSNDYCSSLPISDLSMWLES